MSIFCTLNIESESKSMLPNGFLTVGVRSHVRFIDLGSPEWVSRWRRVRRKCGLSDAPVPVGRYRWQLCSQDFVTSEDIHDHLAWIFGCITPPLSLAAHLDDGYACHLSTYWEFDGPGGGPTIPLKTSELLTKHKVESRLRTYAWGLFRPFVTVCDFLALATCHANPTAESGQNQTFASLFISQIKA